MISTTSQAGEPAEPTHSDVESKPATAASRLRSGGRAGRLRGRRSLARPMETGNRLRSDATPWNCSRSKRRTRLPELVPIRYGRMLVSPFTFFRGAAYIMAADLADGTRTGLQTQLCGDAHLSNFGFFAAPDRRLVFSINDFDETLPGPFEWDVKRLAASFTVAARDLGFDERTRRSVVLATAPAHTARRWRVSRCMRNIDVWYTRLDADMIVQGLLGQDDCEGEEAHGGRSGQGADEGQRAGARQTLSIGRRRTADHRQPPADHADRGRHAGGRTSPPRRGHSPHARHLRGVPGTRSAGTPRALSLRHAARKVVGVGSVGTRAWILLLLGRDDGDPLFLQFKEAQASVLEPFLGRSRFTAARRTSRRRPADDAGGRRHHAGLGANRGDRRRNEGLLHSPTLGREGLRGDRADESRRPRAHTARSAGGHSPEPMPDQATR